MTWHRWRLFVVTELVLCLTPGPAVLFVVVTALVTASAVPSGRTTEERSIRVFARGFDAQAANSKALLFFAAGDKQSRRHPC